MNVVFLGTPEFAVTVLEKLNEAHRVVAVISQPDRAKDRSGRLILTPVKKFALEHELPFMAFEKIREHADFLKNLGADIFVTAAYGQILSQEIIDIPRYGIVNVHASLLPLYRGSSPIQSAILGGDKVTGVTVMQTALGMDTGDILASKAVEINEMNAGQLSETLAKEGADLLLSTLREIKAGSTSPIKQDESRATYCKKIKKEQAEIDWNQSAEEINNIIRAFNPSPVAFCGSGEKRIKIYEAQVVDCFGTPGQIVFADKKNGLVVACGRGGLKIKRLQQSGKSVLTYDSFLNGNKLKIGDYFGNKQ